MDSPLKQVNTGVQNYRPKAASLYDRLFDESYHDEGFWIELFILPVSPQYLQDALNKVPRERVLQAPQVVQKAFSIGVSNLQGPDEFVAINSINLLAVILRWLLKLRLSGAEVLECIAGLDKVEKVFDDLTRGIAQMLSNPRLAQCAMLFFFTVLPPAQGTSVATYFSSRNLFRPLIGLLETSNQQLRSQALILIGIFSLLNKRENHADPYRERIADLIDEGVIAKALETVDHELAVVYKAHNPASSQSSWILSSFVKYWGGPHSEDAKPSSAEPDHSLAILHFVYEICAYNELCASLFVKSQAYCSFSEVGTLIVQSQHLESRYRDYAILCLFISRVLVERPSAVVELTTEDHKHAFAISQNRAPQLHADPEPRCLLAGILNIVQAAIRFNVRKTFDHSMYLEALTVLFQSLHALRIHSQAFRYDWGQLWRTLLSLVKNLASEERPVTSESKEMCELLVAVVAMSLLNPVIFGHDDHNNLLFKVVKSAEIFQQLSMRYELTSTPSVTVIHAMTSQYELIRSQNPTGLVEGEQISTILKQGRHSLSTYEGTQNSYYPKGVLLTESLARFSELAHQRFFAHETRSVLNDAQKITL